MFFFFFFSPYTFPLLDIFIATYTANDISRVWLTYKMKVKTSPVGGALLLV